MGAVHVVILQALGKTAIKWLLYAAAFIALLSAINYGLGFVPFTPQWTAKRERAENAVLRNQVDTLTREATGNAEIATATDTYHQNTVVIREVTAAAIAEARSDPDADTSLPQSRADRLRAHDRSLCNATPALCPAPDPAGSGPGTL